MEKQRKYRVAAVQMEIEVGAVAQNIVHLEALTREAAEGGAKIIVMPEMITAGLFWQDRQHIAPFVEPIPGPTSDHFANLAQELDVYIVVGMAEVDPATNIYYNSAFLAGPEGLIGVHRKVHGYLSDPLWAADGDLGLQVWNTPLGNLGIMICMDANYPESGRLLAVGGADVMLIPTGWMVETCPAPLWITRAFDNGISAICSNRWGAESGNQFSGGACIINPDGTIQNCVGKTTGDEIVFGEIDLDDPRRKRFDLDQTIGPFADRRPALYGTLALNRYLWNAQTMHANFGANPLPESTRFCTVVCELEQPQPVDATLREFDRLLATADRNLPHLFVLPEFSFTGPPADKAHALSLAESLDGTTVQQLQAWCAESGCYIVAGIVERDDVGIYNTLVLVGPDGVNAHYRKTHLSGPDREWATEGDSLVWADTPFGRIGLLAGTDLLYTETVRCLAINGVDVVCVSAALKGPTPIYRDEIGLDQPDTIHWHLARTRAAENDVYVAFSNWRGAYGMGHSGVFFGPSLFDEPERESWAVTDSAVGSGLGVAMMEIDTSAGTAVRTKPGINRRLTAYYAPLLRET
jgi:predicted amidohydrolase